MSSFSRQESDGLDRAAQLLVNLGVRPCNQAPSANAVQDHPEPVIVHKENILKASDNVAEQASEAPALPAAPSNPSVLRKACQLWQHLHSCAEKGFVDVPESLLRSLYKNTADTSKALRRMVEDGLVQRSGAGGKGSPYLYRVTAASLTTPHYGRKPVERRGNKPVPAARRASPGPAAAALAPSESAPSPAAADGCVAGEPGQAAGEETQGGGDEQTAEPVPAVPGDLPVAWRTKPRSGGRRGPRQFTPPEDQSWWQF